MTAAPQVRLELIYYLHDVFLLKLETLGLNITYFMLPLYPGERNFKENTSLDRRQVIFHYNSRLNFKKMDEMSKQTVQFLCFLCLNETHDTSSVQF